MERVAAGARVPALACASLGWLLAGAAALASAGFCLDDAFIHLSYARSLGLGEGFSYNPGDWQTGASSPLWALLLVPFAQLDDPAPPVQVLGVVLHGVTAGLCGLAAARAVDPRRGFHAAWVAGLVAALHPGLLQGAISGMEVPLAAALLALCLWAITAERLRIAVVAGLLSVWARPEALLLLGPIGALLAARDRRLRPLLAPLGAAAGLACWVAYCLTVSGHPWPNTRYVTAVGAGPEGLAYLVVQVVPHEPWLLGVGGLVLVALHMRRPLPSAERSLPPLLLAGWLAAAVAVALTRYLDTQVLFFHRRYFIPLTVAPAVAIGVAAGSSCHHRRFAWLAPVALLSLWTAQQVQGRQRMQERGIQELHVEPARYLARILPHDAVVLVEGAGAARYFTPRSMRIVDMVGLNHGRIAQLPRERRPCAMVDERPTHLLLPRSVLAAVLPLFRTEPLAHWQQPNDGQTIRPHSARVALFRTEGLTPLARSHCPVEAAPR
ncbi:MAG: hypothetical protein PVI30_07640 [Myxococcales bacterium]|jgi:hypothetical protein